MDRVRSTSVILPMTVMFRDENGQASVRYELAERPASNDDRFSMAHRVQNVCRIGQEPFDDTLRDTLATRLQ